MVTLHVLLNFLVAHYNYKKKLKREREKKRLKMILCRRKAFLYFTWLFKYDIFSTFTNKWLKVDSCKEFIKVLNTQKWHNAIDTS